MELCPSWYHFAIEYLTYWTNIPTNVLYDLDNQYSNLSVSIGRTDIFQVILFPLPGLVFTLEPVIHKQLYYPLSHSEVWDHSVVQLQPWARTCFIQSKQNAFFSKKHVLFTGIKKEEMVVS